MNTTHYSTRFWSWGQFQVPSFVSIQGYPTKTKQYSTTQPSEESSTQKRVILLNKHLSLSYYM